MGQNDTSPMDPPPPASPQSVDFRVYSEVRRRASRAEWLPFVDVLTVATARLRELAEESGDTRMRAQATNAEDLLNEVTIDALAAR